ncbi:MAG: EamA family transporter [Candidatus Omnitrophota bacterium]|nr:EamA family transporter [Candidatus Omnitrophota bacterium]
MKKLTFKIFLLLILTDVLETSLQFCFKKSAVSAQGVTITSSGDLAAFIATVIVSPFLWLALTLVLVTFLVWSYVLTKIDLSVATPVASFSYIGVPLVSMVFLHEVISPVRWAGIVLILVGVVLVSVSARSKKVLA